VEERVKRSVYIPLMMSREK